MRASERHLHDQTGCAVRHRGFAGDSARMRAAVCVCAVLAAALLCLLAPVTGRALADDEVSTVQAAASEAQGAARDDAAASDGSDDSSSSGTAAEQYFSQRTVRVSCGINNALYLDESGKPAGYCAAFLEQLAWANGWTYEYVEGSWNESVENLENGTIDLLFPTQKTDERLSTMGFADILGGYQPIGLFAKKDAPIYYGDFSSFDGARIAVSFGTSNYEALVAFAQEQGFTFVPVDMNTTAEKMDALEKGDVDLIAFSMLNTVPDSKIVAVLDYLPFYFSTRSDDQELLDELNKGTLSVMAEHPGVVANMFSAVLQGEGNFSLTRDEYDYIAQAGTVRVGMYDNSLPLFGTTKDGAQMGIYADILRSISANTGLTFEMVAIPRSDFLYDHLDSGDVDLVISTRNLPYLAEDISRYLVSESIMDYVTAVVTMADYSLENDESPRFVLTAARAYLESTIYEMYPEATITYCESTHECLSAIQENRADATYMNTWEFNYQSKNPRFSGMVEWENMRNSSQLVFGATQATDINLLTVVEKAVDSMTEAEQSAIISSNINIPYDEYDLRDWFSMMKGWVLVAAVGLIGVVMALVFRMKLHRHYVRDLEVANVSLDEANRVKTDFLSRMSHELRTPLNAIDGYTSVMQQSLEQHTLDERSALRALDAIKRASAYQLSIIGDLLDIQNIETGHVTLSPSRVEAQSFISDIVDMLNPEASAKGVGFTVESPTFGSDLLLIDEKRLKQVLTNVLHNAVKFTEQDGHVTFSAEVVAPDAADGEPTYPQDVELRFTVRDDGVGMSKDFVDQMLFKRFAQEYHDNTSPYEGCGNGLAIAHELVELMDGTIACESHKGEGTTFVITVPSRLTKPVARSRRKREAVPRDLQGIRVLVCEDNRMNQDIERDILEKLGCDVVIAEDGVVGCDLFAASAPGWFDIVLMDIRMPNRDGIAATRAIRAMDRPDAASVPIVAVSANAFPSDIQDSLAAGMNRHLSKPVDPRTLRKVIRYFCRDDESI